MHIGSGVSDAGFAWFTRVWAPSLGCASGVLGVQCGPTCLLHLWMVGEVVSAGGLHLFAAAV